MTLQIALIVAIGALAVWLFTVTRWHAARIRDLQARSERHDGNFRNIAVYTGMRFSGFQNAHIIGCCTMIDPPIGENHLSVRVTRVEADVAKLALVISESTVNEKRKSELVKLRQQIFELPETERKYFESIVLVKQDDKRP